MKGLKDAWQNKRRAVYAGIVTAVAVLTGGSLALVPAGTEMLCTLVGGC